MPHTFLTGVSLDPELRQQWQASAGSELPALQRGAQAEALGVTLNFSGAGRHGRVARVVTQPGASVPGLLFELDAATFEKVQAFEAARGAAAVPLKVRSAAGKLEATGFSVPPADSSRAIDEHSLVAVVRGAQAAGLPSHYVTALAAEAMIVVRVQQFGREHHLPGVDV